MKKIFLSFAKYNEEADKVVAQILGKLSNEDREKNRKSFYGSLSRLFVHNTECTFYFLSLFKEAVSGNSEALKALEPLAKFGKFAETLCEVQLKNGKKEKKTDPKTGMYTVNLTEDQWKKLLPLAKIVDKALVNFVEALGEKDYDSPVMLEWYGGKPPSAPLWFMLQQLTVHNTHHRGQISQILDSMGIQNNFSGINIKFV